MAVLPFACILTVTDKQGGKVKINSPGAQPSCSHVPTRWWPVIRGGETVICGLSFANSLIDS